MRIYLSPRDMQFADAVSAELGRDVYPDDHTFVDADDELAGATLLADVHNALARARGELSE